MKQRLRIIGVLALVAGLVAGGCGDDDHEAFENCGNGVLDAGETCDDGNLSDLDACLSTCVDAVCGDGFIDALNEDCDDVNLGTSCSGLGLGGGTLECTATCDFDTSGCTGGGGGTPIATPTPVPTSTDGTPGPDPTATPQGVLCGAGETVTVELSLDTAYGGAVTQIAYPTGAVNLPGSFDDDTVAARVTFIPTDGFDQVNDHDTNADSVDDTLTTSFAGTESVPAGPFVQVTFDCLEGQTRPDASAFTCSIDSVSDEIGNVLDGVACSLTIVG